LELGVEACQSWGKLNQTESINKICLVSPNLEVLRLRFEHLRLSPVAVEYKISLAHKERIIAYETELFQKEDFVVNNDSDKCWEKIKKRIKALYGFDPDN